MKCELTTLVRDEYGALKQFAYQLTPERCRLLDELFTRAT